MPVLGSLWLLVLLLFVDNATVSAFSTPLLLLNGHHFEPWQVALLGGTAATLGSVLQFVWLRWIVAGERPWMPRLAPSRAALERALAFKQPARALAVIDPSHVPPTAPAILREQLPLLRPLLDAPTFASFEGAIRGRLERNEKAESTMIGFEASDISAAALQGTIAQVTVRFVSEQINVLRNAEGQIVDGNPNEVQKVIDLWTFRRDTKSSDPNWQLVKTESEG